MRVYLAGPMTGCSFTKADGWRQKASLCLCDQSEGLVRTSSPLRAKTWLAEEGQISALPYAKASPWATPQGITRRDRNDVRSADAILMNLSGAEQISLGTAVELGWADAFGVPVVVVMEDGGVHDHPMVRDIPVAVVPTVEDGCRAILELLNP